VDLFAFPCTPTKSCVAVWTGHMWIKIRTSETYNWNCGLDISGLELGPVRHVWQCGLVISELGLGPVRHVWQCGLGLSGLGLGPVRHVWQCGLALSRLGLGTVRHISGSVDWTYLD
jgi:hypothetical protein